jgi:hypothetical protein
MQGVASARHVFCLGTDLKCVFKAVIAKAAR